jgi:hypothetical protein
LITLPTVSIKSGATDDELVAALQAGLGSDYEVKPKSSEKAVITVQKGTMTTAHIKLERTADVTKAHIHGGGLVISRLINEFGLANKVANVIRSSTLAG